LYTGLSEKKAQHGRTSRKANVEEIFQRFIRQKEELTFKTSGEKNGSNRFSVR